MPSQSSSEETPETALAAVRAKPHRYEAKVSFVLSADSLDEAHWMQQQIVEIVQRHTNDRVMDVCGSMLDLNHRPDLETRRRPWCDRCAHTRHNSHCGTASGERTHSCDCPGTGTPREERIRG